MNSVSFGARLSRNSGWQRVQPQGISSSYSMSPKTQRQGCRRQETGGRVWARGLFGCTFVFGVSSFLLHESLRESSCPGQSYPRPHFQGANVHWAGESPVGGTPLGSGNATIPSLEQRSEKHDSGKDPAGVHFFCLVGGPGSWAPGSRIIMNLC